MGGGVSMASIDKTYIDGKEYPLYRSWWIENYEKMQKELGRASGGFPAEKHKGKSGNEYR